jgi:putative tricarboxylic transport membrane protein
MAEKDEPTGSLAAEGGGDRPEDADGPSAAGRPLAEERIVVIERHSSPRRLGAELLPELGLIAIAAYFYYLAGTFENQAEPGQLGPGFWPRMTAAGLIVALLVRLVQTVRSRNRPIVKVRSEFEEFEDEAEMDWGRLGIAIALAVGYVLATMFLGYLISTALFLAAFIWLGGQRTWYVPLVALAGALVSTYVFIGIVFVALPTGVGVFDVVTVAIYRLLGLQ